MAKQVVLLVGTKKGLYTLRSDANRKKWAVDGPHQAPAPIDLSGPRHRAAPTTHCRRGLCCPALDRAHPRS